VVKAPDVGEIAVRAMLDTVREHLTFAAAAFGRGSNLEISVSTPTICLMALNQGLCELSEALLTIVILLDEEAKRKK